MVSWRGYTRGPFSTIFYLSTLCPSFVVDHLLAGFPIAIEPWLQKIAIAAEEVTSNASAGQTTDHISAEAIPLVGGIVWEQSGGRYTFLIGVVIASACLVLAQWMRVR